MLDKSQILVETWPSPQLPFQKLSISNSSQKTHKSRYQTFPVLFKFTGFLYILFQMFCPRLQTDSNIQNWMVVSTFSIFDQTYPIWVNLVQRIKIVSLSWNLVRRLIQISKIQWCSSFFCFWSAWFVEKINFAFWCYLSISQQFTYRELKPVAWNLFLLY